MNIFVLLPENASVKKSLNLLIVFLLFLNEKIVSAEVTQSLKCAEKASVKHWRQEVSKHIYVSHKRKQEKKEASLE